MTSLVKTELELREKFKLQRDSLIESKDKFKEKVVNTLALAMDNKSSAAPSVTTKKNE